MTRRAKILRIIILIGGILFLFNSLLFSWHLATMFAGDASYSTWSRVPHTLFLVAIVVASMMALRKIRLGCYALELIGIWYIVSAIWHFGREWIAPGWPAELPGAPSIAHRIPAMVIGIAIGAFFIASVFSDNRTEPIDV